MGWVVTTVRDGATVFVAEPPDPVDWAFYAKDGWRTESRSDTELVASAMRVLGYTDAVAESLGASEAGNGDCAAAEAPPMGEGGGSATPLAKDVSDLIQRLRDALAEVLETEPARRASPSIDCMCEPLIDEADEMLAGGG